MSEENEETPLDAEAILADLEPLEDLDDAEFGLPPIENMPTLEEILASNEDNEDDFEDGGYDMDDAASTASTVPIAQAISGNNTLSAALRQFHNGAADTLSINSDSKSRGSSKSQNKNNKDKGSIMRYVGILVNTSFVMMNSCYKVDC
jgi:hypothetical protein